MDFNQKYLAANICVEEKKFYNAIKRIFDIVFSFTGLIVLSPAFLIIAIAIKLDDGGKVIYSSDRVGKHGKVFAFYKFRSMCENADKMLIDLEDSNESGGPLFKMKNDPRITKLGKVLRKTSLDELPQLVNILKGDMSFVGPRPPLATEVEKYDDSSMERLSVVGGLTCYWQISGRSTIDFNGMLELDKKYIKNRGVLTDLKMLFLTVPAVFKGDGAY